MFVKIEAPGGQFHMVDPCQVVAISAVAHQSPLAPDAPPRLVPGVSALTLSGGSTLIAAGEKTAIAAVLEAAAKLARFDEDEQRVESMSKATSAIVAQAAPPMTLTGALVTPDIVVALAIEAKSGCDCACCAKVRDGLRAAGFSWSGDTLGSLKIDRLDDED